MNSKILAMMFPFMAMAESMGMEQETFLSREERKLSRIQLEIQSHIENNKRSLIDEYDLIKEKKSNLSVRCRQFIINYFNNK